MELGVKRNGIGRKQYFVTEVNFLYTFAVIRNDFLLCIKPQQPIGRQHVIFSSRTVGSDHMSATSVLRRTYPYY